jgi:Flp pilus assembly protein TadG
MAVTLPILLGFAFGLMKLCLVFYSYEWISELGREGTRYAIVHGSTCETASSASCTATASTVNAYVLGTGLPNIAGGTVTVNTTYPDGNEAPGSRVKVNLTYAFPYRIPFVTSSTLTISSTSEMYIIQ